MASANTNAQNDKLVILRGDDTGGAFGRTLYITIDAAPGVSLDGCKAEWIFDGIMKTMDAPLVPGEVREIFYSHNETRCMALGVRYGTFRIIDAAGKVRTLTNTKAVEVTDNVARCYPGASSASFVVVGVGDMKHSEFADLEEKEGMTLKEVGSMVNTLVRKLKGTVAAFAAILAFSAFAAVTPTPDTDFGDIDPFAKLKTVVEASGAISGIDTNAVRDIVREQLATNGIRSVDGAARPLPKYLHALDFDDCYTNDAAWYYNQPQDYGSCSAVRDGGFLYRNYDWKFDAAAEFVVKMSAANGRFASVGVANVGTNLTEDAVTSGKWSRYYKCLPGRTVDGVNENGVVCEVNVVEGTPPAPTGGDIHPLGAVRWALDNGTSAGMAASNLAARIAFPAGWTQNFHWMVADAAQTWVVENGAAHLASGKAVMTNFRLYPRDTTGAGQERFDLLAGDAAITNVWYTRAYLRTTNWTSDFKSAAEMEAAKVAWETHESEELRDKGLWQTVHTSIYDITNRVLRVAVQEIDDWYTFQVPSSGAKVDSYTRAETDAKLAEKADATETATALSTLSSSVSGLQSSKVDKTTTVNGKPLTGDVWVENVAHAEHADVAFRVSWSNVASTPTTLGGYNITDAYTMTETEQKIVELAPAPGNYAAVSNAAMNAVQMVMNADANLIFTITSDGAEPRFYFTPVGAINPED